MCLVPAPLGKRLVFSVQSKLFDIKIESINKKSTDLPQVIKTRISELDLHDKACSKIRYVGGSVIGKLNFHTKKVLKNHIHDKNTKIINIMQQRREIYEICAGNLNQSTEYPNSMHTINTKLRGMLTPLSDSSYLFFLHLEKMRLNLCTFKVIATVGTSMPGKMIKSIMSSDKLRNTWVKQFPCELPLELFQNNNVDWYTLLDWLVSRAMTISDTRTSAIELYMKTATKSFSNEICTVLKVEKKEAHRRNISKRKCKEPHKGSSSKKRLSENVHIVTHDDNICEECLDDYKEGDEWIECDGCNGWYCRACAAINEHRWNDISDNNEPWLCNICIGMLDRNEFNP